MQNGKWIHDLDAATPLMDAARRVLEMRLGKVGQHLPAALHQASQDSEHVHQLRVATRRARAALDIFAVCLPQKSYTSAKKQLRKVRRAAGAARDWDVFLAALAAIKPRPSARHAHGCELLTGFALARRQAAASQLADLGSDCPERLQQLQAEVLAAVQSPKSKQTLLQLAQALLADLVRQLEQALAANLEDYACLHQARIAGKRLRYAMEIFGGCFAPAFREQLYPAVEEMQDILGLANDSHVAQGHLDNVLTLLAYVPARAAKRYRPGVEFLKSFHEKQLAQQRELFQTWRQHWPQVCSAAAFATNVG